MKYDQITLERIEKAHPVLREELKELYLECNNNIVPEGKRLRFSDVFRSFDEQQQLYDQGRTTPGKIVTNAAPGQSFHNYGLAFDIVILYGPNFRYASYAVNALWMQIVNFFKSHGYEWGGDWKFGDYPHLQKTFGYTWQQLLELKERQEILDYPTIDIV